MPKKEVMIYDCIKFNESFKKVLKKNRFLNFEKIPPDSL